MRKTAEKKQPGQDRREKAAGEDEMGQERGVNNVNMIQRNCSQVQSAGH